MVLSASQRKERTAWSSSTTRILFSAILHLCTSKQKRLSSQYRARSRPIVAQLGHGCTASVRSRILSEWWLRCIKVGDNFCEVAFEGKFAMHGNGRNFIHG
jgi:hypothetical protein